LERPLGCRQRDPRLVPCPIQAGVDSQFPPWDLTEVLVMWWETGRGSTQAEFSLAAESALTWDK
jgi:hypothetical protein